MMQAQAALSPEEYITAIRTGELEREEFILKYQPFIAAIVSRMVNAPAQGRDEYSIALTAFNDAIDSFDKSRSPGFLHYCELVINRRVIDYIRKDRKNTAMPFTYFEASGNEHIIERALGRNPYMLIENLEVKEEIELFKKRLKRFDITLEQLVEGTPKHIDSRLLCMALAERIAASAQLSGRLELLGYLPAAQLSREAGISRKTVERNRRYITAMYVVMTSNLETIKGYLDFIRKGVSGR